MTAPIDLTGRAFGRLVVIDRGPSLNGKARWWCQCVCGQRALCQSYLLTMGTTRSCGCLYTETRRLCARTHGMTRRAEYRAWAHMRQRCYDPKDKGYERYGGRGIRVCDEWRDSFGAFLRDIGPRPSTQHSLDRHPNNDGHYEPGNVRWATVSEQANNRRSNHILEFQGIQQTVSQWAAALGLPHLALRMRLKSGWSVERALTTPVKESA